MKEKTKKILLINLGGIGDEILFLPAIQSVKNKFPDAKLTLCLEKRSKAIKDLTNIIDDLYLIDNTKNRTKELLKFVFWAKFQKFDITVSSGSNKLIPVLLALIGSKIRIGYAVSNLLNTLLTTAVPLNKNQYAGNMYHDLVSNLTGEGFALPKIDLPYETPKKNVILIHPGVSKMSRDKKMVKTFDGKKWAKLIDRIIDKGKIVYLAGGPDDKEVYSEIIENMVQVANPDFVDCYGKTKNIMDLAKLINMSEMLICSDSAPMHIGVALNKPLLAIFAPTDEKKLLPLSDNFVVIKNNKCKCRACLWDKRSTTCESLECLNISVDEILNFIK